MKPDDDQASSDLEEMEDADMEREGKQEEDDNGLPTVEKLLAQDNWGNDIKKKMRELIDKRIAVLRPDFDESNHDHEEEKRDEDDDAQVRHVGNGR